MFPMFDPFMLAQLSQGIMANPGMFADTMASTGMMPPPLDPGMFGANMNPVMGASPMPMGPTPGGMPMPAMAPGNPPPMGAPAIAGGVAPQLGNDPFAGPPTLGASLGNPPPMGAPMGPQGPMAADPMAALRAAGRGAPQGSMDQKPIMSGGISGAGRAPDAKAGKGASGEMQLLMQLLGGGAGPPVPGLGQLLAAGVR